MKKLILVAVLFAGVNVYLAAEDGGISVKRDATLTVEEDAHPGDKLQKQKKNEGTVKPDVDDDAQKCPCNKPPKPTRDNQE